MSRGDARDRDSGAMRQQSLDIVRRHWPAPMSRSDAARLGGLTTLERHGHEHFREIGRIGFAVTVERYGRDFAHDKAAASREAHPERASHDEQRAMKMLAGLGQGDLLAGEPVEYRREHKVAPSTYVDFAWPDQGKALEVYGGVHRVLAFDPDGLRAQREAVREDAYPLRRLGSADRDRPRFDRPQLGQDERPTGGFSGVAPENWLHSEERRA